MISRRDKVRKTLDIACNCKHNKKKLQKSLQHLHWYSLQSLMHLTHLWMYACLKIHGGRQKSEMLSGKQYSNNCFLFPLWMQLKRILFFKDRDWGNVPQIVPSRKRKKKNPRRRAEATGRFTRPRKKKRKFMKRKERNNLGIKFMPLHLKKNGPSLWGKRK